MKAKKENLAKEQILDILKDIKKNSILSNIKIGLAGSFARGTNMKSSDIDIVLSYDLDRDDADLLILVEEYINKKCGYKVDVLHLERLAIEDEELDNHAKSLDLPINDESAYKSILKDVIWIE
ncbi:nucleotidyltransferase domain-containing protein [Clostridium drakei]|uniref:Polymerase nucleotidyl transferase domain-containing protein n=1 Tax=Clostridium drakei TaxID=332101 RepID=A0A2U8DV98_9CLOT|nr:nucleotidyltransferase domain-containing protein [Clostridium drakei]AWI06716.1 hypothetical protein B9W14_20195 [Clostridium drakei]